VKSYIDNFTRTASPQNIRLHEKETRAMNTKKNQAQKKTPDEKTISAFMSNNSTSWFPSGELHFLVAYFPTA